MRLTLKYLNDYGLVNAGAGESLEEAREAKFIETPKGRVALRTHVHATSRSFKSWDFKRETLSSRPGLSPLRFSTEFMVTKEHFDNIKKLKKELEPNEFNEKDMKFH